LLRTLPNAARFYDANLRPGFDQPDLVGDLLRSAHVVKLNEQELQFVHELLDLPSDPQEFCRVGAERYRWRAACVTLGDRGCAMRVGNDYIQAQACPVEVADTVGAGDAFAAAFLHGLISQWPVARIAAFANRVGAFVAGTHGAIPDQIPDAILNA
jgi:fructokinase